MNRCNNVNDVFGPQLSPTATSDANNPIEASRAVQPTSSSLPNGASILNNADSARADLIFFRLANQVLWLCVQDRMKKGPQVSRLEVKKYIEELMFALRSPPAYVLARLPVSARSLFATLAQEPNGIECLEIVFLDCVDAPYTFHIRTDDHGPPFFFMLLCILLENALRFVPDAVAALMEVGLDINARDRDGWTALHCAADVDNVKVARALIAAKADVSAMLRTSRLTPLALAVTEKHEEIVKLLLDAKADVKQKLSSDTCALFWGASGANGRIIRMLLAAKADVNSRNMIGYEQAILRGSGGNVGHPPLMMAVENKNIEVIQVLIDAGAKVNIRSASGMTALLFAAHGGSFDIVQMLVNAGANVNVRAPDGRTPLYSAVDDDHANMVQLLINAKADLDQPGPQGATPLYRAAAKGSVALTRKLLFARANVNSVNASGHTPLMAAIMNNHAEVIQVLIDMDADVDAEAWGTTPLSEAINRDDTRAVRILVEAGAKIVTHRGEDLLKTCEKKKNYAMAAVIKDAMAVAQEKQKECENELFCAARGDKPEWVLRGLLLKVKVECVDKHGNTPLHVAVLCGNEVATSLLLAAKAKVDVTNKHGVSPLMAAVMDVGGGGVALVDRLVKAKADVSAKNKQGKTPLMVAVYHGRQAMVERLLAVKAKVNVCDTQGTTALMLAARGGCVGVLQALLAAKGDVRVRDKQGNTALLLGVRSGSVECVRALLAAKAEIGVKNKRKQGVLELAVGKDVRVLLQSHFR